MARVHLVDASPYIFRAYFSLPSSIKAPDWSPGYALRGFASFRLKLVAVDDVTHLGLAFDESLTTSFRNEIYPEYKAQRDLPPAELEMQLKSCQEVAKALGATTWVNDRYEADDLVGAACKQLVAAGHEVVVVTSDKDLCQLVGDRVSVLDVAKDRRIGPADVVDVLGVRSDQVVDLLALAGDPVDNIPGVAGVGRKTAAGLLDRFDDMDAIYADLEAVAACDLRGAKSVAAKLAASREVAFLSRRLATLAFEAPAEADAQDLKLGALRAADLDPVFERLGLSRLVERYFRGLVRGQESEAKPTGLVAELAGLFEGADVEDSKEGYTEYLIKKYS